MPDPLDLWGDPINPDEDFSLPLPNEARNARRRARDAVRRSERRAEAEARARIQARPMTEREQILENLRAVGLAPGQIDLTLRAFDERARIQRALELQQLSRDLDAENARIARRAVAKSREELEAQAAFFRALTRTEIQADAPVPAVPRVTRPAAALRGRSGLIMHDPYLTVDTQAPPPSQRRTTLSGTGRTVVQLRQGPGVAIPLGYPNEAAAIEARARLASWRAWDRVTDRDVREFIASEMRSVAASFREQVAARGGPVARPVVQAVRRYSPAAGRLVAGAIFRQLIGEVAGQGLNLVNPAAANLFDEVLSGPFTFVDPARLAGYQPSFAARQLDAFLGGPFSYIDPARWFGYEPSVTARVLDNPLGAAFGSMGMQLPSQQRAAERERLAAVARQEASYVSALQAISRSVSTAAAVRELENVPTPSSQAMRDLATLFGVASPPIDESFPYDLLRGLDLAAGQVYRNVRGFFAGQ